ncbi:MAG: hypothetical protein ABIQ18_00535, partial [Umezawaea sp.]
PIETGTPIGHRATAIHNGRKDFDMTNAGAATPEAGGCLAYAVYYFTGPAEQAHGPHSDLVAALNGNDPRDVTVVWAFSEELCNREVCGYCRRWKITGPCPGVHTHGVHALGRINGRFPLYDMEIGVFDVPSGLSPANLTGEIERQFRGGVTHAEAC